MARKMRRVAASGRPARTAKEIRDARLEIDAIDRAIVRQLARRARVVAEISRLRGAARRDPKREREVVRNAVWLHRATARQSGIGYPDGAVEEIFRIVLEAGGAVQADATSGRSRLPRRAGGDRSRASSKRRRKQKES